MFFLKIINFKNYKLMNLINYIINIDNLKVMIEIYLLWVGII